MESRSNAADSFPAERFHISSVLPFNKIKPSGLVGIPLTVGHVMGSSIKLGAVASLPVSLPLPSLLVLHPAQFGRVLRVHFGAGIVG